MRTRSSFAEVVALVCCTAPPSHERLAVLLYATPPPVPPARRRLARACRLAGLRKGEAEEEEEADQGGEREGVAQFQHHTSCAGPREKRSELVSSNLRPASPTSCTSARRRVLEIASSTEHIVVANPRARCATARQHCTSRSVLPLRRRVPSVPRRGESSRRLHAARPAAAPPWQTSPPAALRGRSAPSADAPPAMPRRCCLPRLLRQGGRAESYLLTARSSTRLDCRRR